MKVGCDSLMPGELYSEKYFKNLPREFAVDIYSSKFKYPKKAIEINLSIIINM